MIGSGDGTPFANSDQITGDSPERADWTKWFAIMGRSPERYLAGIIERLASPLQPPQDLDATGVGDVFTV